MDPIFIVSAIAAVLAYIVKGLTGFANTLVFSSILSFFQNNISISPVELILGTPSNFFIAIRERKAFKPRVVFPLAGLVILGCVPGILLLKGGNPKLIKTLFGAAITLVGAESLIGEYLHLKPSKIFLGIIGIVAGVMCGMYGIGGLLVAYVSRTTKTPAEFRANTCFVFILVDIFRFVMYGVTGVLTLEILKTALMLTPFMIIGMVIGTLMAKRLNAVLVKRIIMILIVLSGISIMITNLI